MNKKLIRLTEQDLHRIVKESVGKILKEGYYDDLHDYWGQEDEPNLICPYCESDNVQEVRGKDGSWDGSCRCYDCGKVFDIDSASMNESIEYHGPTPFSIGDVAYHNQQLRGEIKDIIEFCDIAKNIPREHKHANFYTQLIKNLHDLDTHAWWDLDNADDI